MVLWDTSPSSSWSAICCPNTSFLSIYWSIMQQALQIIKERKRDVGNKTKRWLRENYSGDELKDAVEKYPRHSLVGQWLELCVLTAEGQSSIPGWGIKISQAMWYGQKQKWKHPQSKWTILKPLHMCDWNWTINGWQMVFSLLKWEVGNKQEKEARMIDVVLD